MRVFLALLIAALPSAACSCVQLSACDLVRRPVIFVGRVIDGGVASIRDDPWYSSATRVRFQVLENFRGLPAGTQTVDMELLPTAGMCASNPYFPGRTYLVAPANRDGQFVDGVCFAGRDVEKAAEDVKTARSYFAGRRSVSIRGRVAATREPSLVDFLLEMGEAKPLGGVTIAASRAGITYSALTDQDGSYSLVLPEKGDYDVRAVLDPYRSGSDASSGLRAECGEVMNFALTTDNTISGRVLDTDRQPMKNAQVGLIDLDRAPSESDRHPWFSRVYTEKQDLSFQFQNVPIGRYLLVFNPDGPRSGSLFDLPLESTYYPMGSSRATATPFEIQGDGIHLTGMDLLVGKPVQFRSVTVHVHFPDGAPMDTAKIRCVGSPLQPGELSWVYEKYVIRGEKGTLSFAAPANRRLQLEVTDAYKRPLKARYTATYEPGNSPIGKEFVVVP